MSLLFAATEIHWAWTAMAVLTIPALIALNAFFVAAEFALVAIRRTRVEEMIRLGMRRAKAIETAIVRLDRSIAATQLGITLASIALGVVGEPALAAVIGPVFDAVPPNWRVIATHSSAAIAALTLVTFMHVVFGELIPKTVALQDTDRVALRIATPLNVFAKLSRPFTLLISGVANRLLRLFGYEPASAEETVHSIEELLLLIEDTEEAGILRPGQADLVQNVFRLSNKKVRDCMVPRERMTTLALSTPPDQVLEVVRETAHTRMPIYDGEPDRIVGVVNTKDLFHLYSLRGVAILEDAMYPALFLSPDEPIATALQLFRKSHRPMALVRDPEGKIHGLITLEDILEEIVGDIEDEHDRPVPKLVLRRHKRKPPAAEEKARGQGDKKLSR